MTSFNSVINQFNKNYPLYEKNFKNLMHENKRLSFYIRVLIIVVIFLVISLFSYTLLKLIPEDTLKWYP